jgi:hypothetical protein
VAANVADSARVEAAKPFPNSNRQLGKWDRKDALGFLMCWVFVALVVVVLWGDLNLGR